ncbi:DUF882 domain-containing protein [Hydrogenophaga sp. 2FB]|uniref:YcbK family protein n=1 Tax=Hydrogenophaga sp. 2FB TaxID=2502187 RepID=UPI0010F949FC|nr:DUF882 domain-containing protein [Hydrogenophaga sp. 2FB]
MMEKAVSRRGLILFGCAAVVASPAVVLAQDGFGQFRNDLQTGGGNGFSNPEARRTDPGSRTIVIETPSSADLRGRLIEPKAQVLRPGVSNDWRQGLLHGDRTVKARRGGGAVETITYVNRDGSLNVAGYQRMCWLLRDVRGGDAVIQMDLGVMDLVCGLQRWAAYNGVESIITFTSGLRGDKTNARTEGAVKDSLHKKGRAIDFVMGGIRAGQLGAMVSTFNSRGGTGIYLAKNFVHADTGRPRVWRG